MTRAVEQLLGPDYKQLVEFVILIRPDCVKHPWPFGEWNTLFSMEGPTITQEGMEWLAQLDPAQLYVIYADKTPQDRQEIMTVLGFTPPKELLD